MFLWLLDAKLCRTIWKFSNCITTQSPRCRKHSTYVETSQDLHRVSYNVQSQCPLQVHGARGYRGGVQLPVVWPSHCCHWGLPLAVTICSRKSSANQIINFSLAPMRNPGTGSCSQVQRHRALAMPCRVGPHPLEGVSAH